MVFLWDVASRELLYKLSGHNTYVHRLAFSDDGTVLASAGRTIRIWDVESGEPLDSFPTGESWAPFLSFSPDASALAFADEGGVKLLQLGSPANPRVRRLPDDWDRLFSISPDGATGVIGTTTERIGTTEGRIEVWDIATDAVISEFPHGHGAKMTFLDWSDENRQVVSTGRDGVVKLWNADTGELLKTFEHESVESEYTRAWFPSSIPEE